MARSAGRHGPDSQLQRPSRSSGGIRAKVLRLDGSITVPYGAYTNVLVTSERSPLEPQTEQKYYAPGVGELAERVVMGHHEEFQLVQVTH